MMLKWPGHLKLHWIYKIRNILSDAILHANDSRQWVTGSTVSMPSPNFFFFSMYYENIYCLGIHYLNFRSSNNSALRYRNIPKPCFVSGLNMIFRTAPHPPIPHSVLWFLQEGILNAWAGRQFLCLPKSPLIRAIKRPGWGSTQWGMAVSWLKCCHHLSLIRYIQHSLCFCLLSFFRTVQTLWFFSCGAYRCEKMVMTSVPSSV